MITLVIVDCQNDFITGTMGCKNAKSAVEEIKKFIKNHRKEIEKILFTVDWHPYNHMSFKKYGGDWPNHCVQYTPGAFEDIEYVQDSLGERYYFDSIVTANAKTDFVICGIANCTTYTISNLLKNDITPKVFMPGIISNDGNRIFSSFIKENNLTKTT